jgi:hypothetical protein
VTSPEGAAGTGGGPAAVDVSRLDALEGLPVAEHVAVFDAVHRELQDALATLDQA